jgi:predicted nucleic acid-binding protein
VIVIDAGALLEVLLRSAGGRQVERAISDTMAQAPHLLDAEVLHRLVVLGEQGAMTANEVATAVDDLRDAPIIRVDHDQLLRDALRFSAALSGYDAMYVALAGLLTCPLLTTDGRLARTARSQFAVDAIDVTASRRSAPPGGRGR